MILLIAAALAAAPAAATCPDVVTPDAFVCRALEASKNGKPEVAATAFEQAALATDDKDPAKARMLAAAGNMWIAAGQPGKAALALDRALAGTGLEAEQRGEALLDRARAAESQNDLKTARAKLTEAARDDLRRSLLLVFLGGCGDPRARQSDRPSGDRPGAEPRARRPHHPVRSRPRRPFRRGRRQGARFLDPRRRHRPHRPGRQGGAQCAGDPSGAADGEIDAAGGRAIKAAPVTARPAPAKGN